MVDVITIIAIVGGIIGIIAGIVQIVDYLEKRRAKQAIPPMELVAETTQAITSSVVNQTALSQWRGQLEQYFSESELKTLCFDLGIEYENLPGDTKSDKTRELVETMQRHNRLSALVQQCRHYRPNVLWADQKKGTLVMADYLSTTRVIAHNLPRRRSFIGRNNKKAAIQAALLNPDTYAVSIVGGGGIGKSSLALAIAYDSLTISDNQLQSTDVATFAGYIWISAKDRELTLNALLDTIISTLDYPEIAQQSPQEKQVATERLLRSAPYLIILDNLETVNDDIVYSFIRTLPAPTKVLITTRKDNLNWATIIRLGGLNESEAIALIKEEGKRLGLSTIVDDKEHISQLIEVSKGSPLAIRWAVGQIKQKGQTIESVLFSLKKGHTEILEDLFYHSWSLLNSDAQFLLLAMSLFAAPVQQYAMKDVSELQDGKFEQALGQLVEMSLVEPSDDLKASQRRYDTHSLVRGFAVKKFKERDPGWQAKAKERLAVYFLRLVRNVQGREVNWEAWELVDDQFLNILIGIEWCYTNSMKMTVEYAQTFASYLTRRGYWDEALELGINAKEAAMKLAEQEANSPKKDEWQMDAGRLGVWPVSWVYRHKHKLEESEEILLQAIAIFTRLKDEEGLARAWRFLGRTYQERFHVDGTIDYLDRADEMLRNALAYYQRPAGKKTSLVHTLLGLGRIAYDKQQYDIALSFTLESLKIGTEIGFTEGIGTTSITLGEIKLAQAKFDEARKYFLEGRQKMNEVARVDGMADAIIGLAQVEAISGNKSEAQKLAFEALDVYERIGQIQEVKKLKELFSDFFKTVQ